jgi:hypothetical protein
MTFTLQRPFSDIPPAHRRILLEAAGSHFHLHAETCRVRACRRIHACRSTTTADGNHEPPCIAGLCDNDRATLDKLLHVLSGVYHGTLLPPPAEDGERQWLEDHAIAIMRAALPRLPDMAKPFAYWHKRFIAPPSPPLSAGEVLRQMKAEMELDDLRRERRAIEARMRT